jgi:hypothetical protein
MNMARQTTPRAIQRRRSPEGAAPALAGSVGLGLGVGAVGAVGLVCLVGLEDRGLVFEDRVRRRREMVLDAGIVMISGLS